MILGSETNVATVSQVRSLMDDLDYHAAHTVEHPIVAAAAFHAMFENIHPFSDGNGRTGRIVMNWMLERAGYPPIALKAANRAAYLTALEDWQVRDEPAALIGLVADQVAEEAEARRAFIMQSREG